MTPRERAEARANDWFGVSSGRPYREDVRRELVELLTADFTAAVAQERAECEKVALAYADGWAEPKRSHAERIARDIRARQDTP